MLQKIPFPEKIEQRRALFLVYIIIIGIVSLFPADSSALPVKHIDKVGHFFAYVLMAILAFKSSEGIKGQIRAFALTLIVAFLLEWAQVFVPGRLSNMADGITNYLGLLTGLLINQIYQHKFKKNQ